MRLIPIFEGNIVKDGCYIRMLPFCVKNCTSEKCQKHYLQLKGKSEGFYTCPYGMSSLVLNDDNNQYIFSCLRERKSYNKERAKIISTSENVFNPVMGEEQLVSLAKREIEADHDKAEYSSKISEVNDLLHETRKYNGEIKTLCDLVWETSPDEIYNIDDLINRIRNIHTYSFMVYNRFLYFDTVVNPGLSLGNPYRAIIFKKFDKMRKLLKEYSRKNVRISLDTPSTYSYMIYPSFETLLFILLENDIKYSPDGKTINVNFASLSENCLDVTIESIGPFCHSSEIEKLGSKGFRSEQAKLMDKSGQGIGLHFAKQICDLHMIDISYSSEYKYKDHGVVYGTFMIKLHFDKIRINN